MVEEHDETGGGAGGHEEVYIVVAGRATFTVGGETLDAPAGTIVFISRPGGEAEGGRRGGGDARARRRRRARARLRGLALGVLLRCDARVPGGALGRGDRADARGARASIPGNPAILYNLACAESRAAGPSMRSRIFGQAIRRDPKYAERARDDSDFDPIRARARLPG